MAFFARWGELPNALKYACTKTLKLPTIYNNELLTKQYLVGYYRNDHINHHVIDKTLNYSEARLKCEPVDGRIRRRFNSQLHHEVLLKLITELTEQLPVISPDEKSVSWSMGAALGRFRSGWSTHFKVCLSRINIVFVHYLPNLFWCALERR